MRVIRAAENREYEKVLGFYDDLIDAMQGAEYAPGWEKGVYPAPDFLRRSIEHGELFLAEEEGILCAAMVVNHEYNESYRKIRFSLEVSDAELWVIHALGVHPRFARRGIAGELVRFVIARAEEEGIRTVRLDVLEGNLPAERTYPPLGFRYLDTIQMFYEDTGWTGFKVYEYIV